MGGLLAAGWGSECLALCTGNEPPGPPPLERPPHCRHVPLATRGPRQVAGLPEMRPASVACARCDSSVGQAGTYLIAAARSPACLLAPLEHVAPHVPSLVSTTLVHTVAAHCSSGVHATNQWSTVCCRCRPVITGQTCTPDLPSLFALSCQPHATLKVNLMATVGWPRPTSHKGQEPHSWLTLLQPLFIPFSVTLPSSIPSHRPPASPCPPPSPSPASRPCLFPWPGVLHSHIPSHSPARPHAACTVPTNTMQCC